ETHVVTWYEVTEADYDDRLLPPIGKPISNTTMYVVDQYGGLCGIGVIGELWFGGIQVAKGYLALDELTKQKFIPDPFSQEGVIYKTGDIGRWLPDGNIEFLGRRDDQIKIRGNRVEI